MKNLKRNLTSYIIAAAITIMAIPVMATAAGPGTITVTVSEPSSNSVNAGVTVTYVVVYSGDVGGVYLQSGDIATVGFSADISVTGDGNVRTITLANIQGEVGGDKYIRFGGGTAATSDGEFANAVAATIPFSITDDESVSHTLSIIISEPSKSQVRVGEDVTFSLIYNDNIRKIDLNAGDISTVGFTADVSIIGDGNVRTVTLSNIQGSEGYKFIMLSGGTAWNDNFEFANSKVSTAFQLEGVDGSTNFSTDIDGYPFILSGGQYQSGGQYNAVITHASVAGGGEAGKDTTNLRVRVYFFDNSPNDFKLSDGNSFATIIDQDESVGAFIFLIELPTKNGKVDLPKEYFDSFNSQELLQIVYENDSGDNNPPTGAAIPLAALLISGTVAVVFKRKK
ncbi:MAG: hypothetical protein FWD34_06180 [Oscillospiraceae bacterium]|nr:hypothetical protein [Oscillospiraceae bacterium]